MAFDIFIDVNRQEAVRSFTDATIVALPPFIQGDTPTLRIWPLVQNSAFQNSIVPYAYLGTAGLSLEVALGTRVGSSSLHYTEQFVWTSDANSQYFSASLSLDTAAITTLLGSGSDADAWFEVKYVNGGFPTTILDKQVKVRATVIKAGAVVVPPGATQISSEEVNASFLKRKISGAIFLEDVNNPGSYAAVFIQNGALKVDQLSPFQSASLPFAPDNRS